MQAMKNRQGSDSAKAIAPEFLPYALFEPPERMVRTTRGVAAEPSCRRGAPE